jgi:hypothetical protein
MQTKPKSFHGSWRIIQMDEWNEENLDIVETARSTIYKRGQGEFVFGTVKGWLDCRFTERERLPLVEFSWRGLSERGLYVWPGMGKPSIRRDSQRAPIHPPKRRFGFSCETQQSS